MADHIPVRAVLFDAYGTLFRLESIEAVCQIVMTESGSATTGREFAGLWRVKQLEYTVHRSLLGTSPGHDFAAVTAEALDFTADRFGLLLTPTSRQTLLDAWVTPAVDPAAAQTLDALAPIPCGILSNGTTEMVQTAVAAADLSDRLPTILCASTVGIFKPSPQVYALGPTHFGLDASEIGFVTANGWDAAGAGTFGFRICWVNRLGLPIERHGPKPEAIVDDLSAVRSVFRGA